jgi:DUF1009 family protein
MENTTKSSTLGIIAGAGALPRIVARQASESGVGVVCARIEGFATPEIGAWCRTHESFPLGQLRRIISFLLALDADTVVLCGHIDHREVFKTHHVDDLMGAILAGGDLRAESILGSVTNAIEAQGLSVGDMRHWLGPHLIEPGPFGKADLDDAARKAARFGWPLAREVANINVGQSIAVRGGVVIAVEAVEGTDRMIARCGELNVDDCVIIKLPSARKDPRFDLPVIGSRTVEMLQKAKANALVVAAGMTIVIDPVETRAAADAAGIAVLACDLESGVPA